MLTGTKVQILTPEAQLCYRDVWQHRTRVSWGCVRGWAKCSVVLTCVTGTKVLAYRYKSTNSDTGGAAMLGRWATVATTCSRPLTTLAAGVSAASTACKAFSQSTLKAPIFATRSALVKMPRAKQLEGHIAKHLLHIYYTQRGSKDAASKAAGGAHSEALSDAAVVPALPGTLWRGQLLGATFKTNLKLI